MVQDRPSTYLYSFPAVRHSTGAGNELLINKVEKSHVLVCANNIQSCINRKDQLRTVYVRGEGDDMAEEEGIQR